MQVARAGLFHAMDWLFKPSNRHNLYFNDSIPADLLENAIMRKVPIEQELKKASVPAIAKAAKELLETHGKDTGLARVDAYEDGEGRRFIRLLVEVS